MGGSQKIRGLQGKRNFVIATHVKPGPRWNWEKKNPNARKCSAILPHYSSLPHHSQLFFLNASLTQNQSQPPSLNASFSQTLSTSRNSLFRNKQKQKWTLSLSPPCFFFSSQQSPLKPKINSWKTTASPFSNTLPMFFSTLFLLLFLSHEKYLFQTAHNKRSLATLSVQILSQTLSILSVTASPLNLAALLSQQKLSHGTLSKNHSDLVSHKPLPSGSV